MRYSVEGKARDAQSGVKPDLPSRAGRRERAARCVERACGRRVVLLVELERDRVADRRADVRWGEREHACAADDDLVVDPSRRRRARRRGGRRCRARGSGRGAASGCGDVPERVVRRVGLEHTEIGAGVHREDHALLAVICLAAEHPCRLRRLYVQLRDGEAGRLCRRNRLAA